MFCVLSKQHTALYMNALHFHSHRSKTGMSIIFGMCVPAVCSMDLLQNLVDESKLTDPNVMSIDFLEASCQVAGEPSGFTRLDYITT